jgi:hypothetical protein
VLGQSIGKVARQYKVTQEKIFVGRGTERIRLHQVAMSHPAEPKREARDSRDPRSPLNVSTGDRAEYIEVFGNVLKKANYAGSLSF